MTYLEVMESLSEDRKNLDFLTRKPNKTYIDEDYIIALEADIRRKEAYLTLGE